MEEIIRSIVSLSHAVKTFIFLFYNSAMLRFTSSSRAACCLQPKGSTQGLWLEQIWEVWHFQPHFHRHLFAGDPELTQPCFITGDSLRRSLWDCLCPALPLQLQALCGAQSWAGLIREECSALHAIAITLLMTPVSLSGFLSFSTTAIFSTDDCLLWQSDCGGCARAWLAFSRSGQGAKQAPSKQNTSHRKMLPDVQKVHQYRCHAPVYTGHAGKLYQHQALGAAAVLCHACIFCLATAKGPMASRPDSVRMKLTEQLWQGKKAGSSCCFIWFSMFFSAHGTNL